MYEKIKLLLIEDNINQRLEFKTCIHFHKQFELYGETGSEKEALNILKNGYIDVIVLDLELQEGNGIQLAERMRELPIDQPFVAVTTNNCSESILQYLRKELKVDFIFQKANSSYTPNQVLFIIEKAFKYHKSKNANISEEKQLLRKSISQELQNIGFSIKYIGTEYITAALLLLSEIQDDYYQISKTIYPALATQYQTDPANIEKAIRMAIEHVWNNASLIQLQKHYPFDVNNKNGRPSNGEFISNMKIRLYGKSEKTQLYS
ncbi:response regulator receiver domain-containing protein [Lachnotalea glycerini]|nr:sporulation initiation factor Spo0A C-terminal domain-containing protein [Lachnotalea glycerini]PXV89559.1 response regulator receiver domain-containing protein [Lachnotalea glycerini]